MQFFASVRPMTHLYRRWRGEGRKAGVFRGVRFEWDGVTYSSGALDSAGVAAVSGVHGMDVEVVTAPSDAAVMVAHTSEAPKVEESEPEEADDTPYAGLIELPDDPAEKLEALRARMQQQRAAPRGRRSK